MNLTIDIGNTFAKAALFDEKGVQLDAFYKLYPENLDVIFDSHDITSTIVCSVGGEAEPWLQRARSKNKFELNYQLPLPVSNSYDTPKTLGMDRVASVVGGRTLFPNQDLLVIDAGTCMTYDYLQSDTYKGGAIAPGLQMKLKALHNFTKKLPLVELLDSTPLIGTTTDSSILSGVLNGTLAEITKTIDDYKRISNNLAVILCGGDAELLGKNLKNVDSVESGLVFTGLNEILEYNVEKNR